jgi:hypothetical protein
MEIMYPTAIATGTKERLNRYLSVNRKENHYKKCEIIPDTAFPIAAPIPKKINKEEAYI